MASENRTSNPRVTSAYLDSYVGKNVTVVGKLMQLRAETAIIDADGNITAQLNREAHLTPGNAVQIIGKVNQDLSIRVLSSLDLGPLVDLQLANTVAEITNQHRDIFVFDN